MPPVCPRPEPLPLALPPSIAARVAPNDPDLRKKLVECEKAVKRIRFEEALARPEDYKKGFDTAKELCRSMAVPEEYKGPR